MRTRNPSYNRARDVAEGRLGIQKAGSAGIRIRDAAGNDIPVATTLHVPWVIDLSEYEAQIGSDTGSTYTNSTDGVLNVGDVVVLDGTTVITTATAQDTRPVGVIVAGGASGATVAVQTAGYCSLVHVTASVTAGNYLETSTTAGDATENATRRTGSFGVILTSGTAPSALLFGVPDTGSGSVDFLLKYGGEEHTIKDHPAMGSTETIDPADGNIHTGTLTANCTITLTNPTASVGAIIECRFTQDGTGGWTVTWPGSVTFLGTSTPTSTAAGTTAIYLLESLDGGSSWVAVIVGSGGTPASTVTDETTFGISPVVGTDTEYARQDHTHGSPANPVTLTAVAALGFLTGPTFTVIGQEQRISDGSTTTWPLDNDFEENSVSARNLTTGHVLSITETLPNSVLISAAGTAGDVIAFAYAASVV